MCGFRHARNEDDACCKSVMLCVKSWLALHVKTVVHAIQGNGLHRFNFMLRSSEALSLPSAVLRCADMHIRHQ